MAKPKSSKSAKKENVSECEVEVLLSDVKARKHISFGNLSSGIKNSWSGGGGGLESCTKKIPP